MKKKNASQVTENGLTTVNIDENDELQELIKKIAILSLQKEIKLAQITSSISKERQLYKEGLIVIPEESEDEKRFREKAECFFERTVDQFVQERWRITNSIRRDYEITNVIEIACASYKLYKELAEITQRTIYEKAKNRMKSKPKEFAQEYWGTKFSKVQCWTTELFEDMSKKLLKKDKSLEKKCKEFLRQYEYKRGTEENVLKIIFLIDNYN